MPKKKGNNKKVFTYPKRKKNDKLSFNCKIVYNGGLQKVKQGKIQFIDNFRENNLIDPLYIRLIRDNVKKYQKLKIGEDKINFSIKANNIPQPKPNYVYVKKIINPFKQIDKKDSELRGNEKNLKSNNEKLPKEKEDKKNNNNGIINGNAKKKNSIKNTTKSINNALKTIVKTLNPIKKADTQKKEIRGDGNCYYRCVSYFLLGDESYFNEIKNEIIKWIEGNKDRFIEFFADDDENNISKEEKAEDELNYIKTRDSWGGFHTIEISNIIFNISTAIYIDNGDDNYKKYFYCENLNENSELMIMLYKDNNHFDLLYDKNLNLDKSILNDNINNLNINKEIKKEKINIEGIKLENKYVNCNFKSSEKLYDEISNYLKSIQKYENEIKMKQLIHKNWHYNQILALFDIKYPSRMIGKTELDSKKRQLFRKKASKYKLDKNNRLCIINPLNIIEEANIYYKIPYSHEKNILINHIHINNNHCGRIQIINYLHKNHWYWYGMNHDIQEQIKTCINCYKPNKFKELKKKNKIIIDNGPHYRYVADLWYLNNSIQENSGYKYVIDIIDHFSKWYGGYLLKTKSAEEVLKKIDFYIENFGKPKILQVDNGTEFSNNLLDSYCIENGIKLIHSSPYHPQTNGVCEAVHKEIRKYIYDKYINGGEEFNIEDELFNITKIHNNKVHSTTKRIPKDIRDIIDIEEIKSINDNIKKTLEAKNKNFDIIDFSKYYVFDNNSCYKSNGKIYKKKGKSNKKTICKIPVKVICEIYEGDEYLIEIKKNIGTFDEGEIYSITINLLEEVNASFWNNLLN